MNRTVRTGIRLAGLGLVAFGLLYDLSSGWAMTLVAVGLGAFFLAGGPC